VYIKVKVKVGQKAESFEMKNEDTFLATVKEKAERNQANKRILILTARYFKIPIGKVRMINGHTQPSKILSVDI
jgi:uncharacterized protein YggU (UPF0235/DUF167 family)